MARQIRRASRRTVWTVDLDDFDFGEKLHLYRDGVEVEVQKSPATFDLGPGATIEASMSLLGMKRIDLIVDGETTMLAPVDGTAEAWRPTWSENAQS